MWVSATVKSLQKKRSKGDIVDFSVWHLEAQISVKNKPSTDDVAVEDILAVLLTYGQVGQSPTGPVCAQNISWGQLGDIASTNTDSRRFSLPSVTKYPIHNCPDNYAKYKDPVLDLFLFFYHSRGMQFLEHPTSIRTPDSVAQMLLKHIQPNFETIGPRNLPHSPPESNRSARCWSPHMFKASTLKSTVNIPIAVSIPNSPHWKNLFR